MIKTQRTYLSLFTASDTAEAIEMFLEPDTFKYIKPMLHASVDQHQTFLNRKLEEIKTKKGYYWVVRLIDTNTFIGTINLTPIMDEPEKIQIGWVFKSAHHRKGFATECALAVLQHAIDQLPFKEIFGVYETENIASKKIFQKLNFDIIEIRTPKNDVPLVYCKYII